AETLRGPVHFADAGRIYAEALIRPDVDFVLLAAFVVGRDLIAADQQPQALRDVGDVDAEVGSLLPVDRRAQLGLAHDQRGVSVHHARHLLELVEQPLRILTT